MKFFSQKICGAFYTHLLLSRHMPSWHSCQQGCLTQCACWCSAGTLSSPSFPSPHLYLRHCPNSSTGYLGGIVLHLLLGQVGPSDRWYTSLPGLAQTCRNPVTSWFLLVPHPGPWVSEHFPISASGVLSLGFWLLCANPVAFFQPFIESPKTLVVGRPTFLPNPYFSALLVRCSFIVSLLDELILI